MKIDLDELAQELRAADLAIDHVRLCDLGNDGPLYVTYDDEFADKRETLRALAVIQRHFLAQETNHAALQERASGPVCQKCERASPHGNQVTGAWTCAWCGQRNPAPESEPDSLRERIIKAIETTAAGCFVGYDYWSSTSQVNVSTVADAVLAVIAADRQGTDDVYRQLWIEIRKLCTPAQIDVFAPIFTDAVLRIKEGDQRAKSATER